MVRQGNIDNPPKTPLVPGFECSGIVEALGPNTTGFEIGERVMAFVNYGAWAEVVCAPLDFVYPVPDAMTFPEAAAFLVSFVAAYMMLFEIANLQEGMTVLVHSAGGAVNMLWFLRSPREHDCSRYLHDEQVFKGSTGRTWAENGSRVFRSDGIDDPNTLLFAHVGSGSCVFLKGQAIAQLCSSVPHVAVFGTASPSKHEAIRDSMTFLFDRNTDYVQEIKKISPEGVDVVLDCLCGEDTGKGLSLLKPLGTYVLYGSANMVTRETKSFFSLAKSWWQVEKVNPMKLYEENKTIAGFSLLNLLFRQGRADRVQPVVWKLLSLYREKKIRPVVDSLWALEEVKEAMQRLHDRGNIGKLILDIEKAPTPLMANDSTETSEAGEDEDEDEQDDDSDSKERVPFIQ